MVLRYRFKTSSTRRVFCQLGRDPETQSSLLRSLAHISSRVSDVDFRTMLVDLLLVLNDP